jgi:hypothetical protein
MKERPILFTGDMVHAILEGRKTMTRRVIKPQPVRSVTDWTMDAEEGEAAIYRGWPHWLEASRGRNKRDAGELTPRKIACPYGQPGDRLWVRETFCPTVGGCEEPAIYQASYEEGKHLFEPYWRPSIFMPRALSRILLEVTAVRVERVQDIGEEDARAEGIAPNWVGDLKGWNPEEHGFLGTPLPDPDSEEAYYRTGREAFAELWNSINAKRGYGWDANPWVWVINFRRVMA